jgi:hypothetical protein
MKNVSLIALFLMLLASCQQNDELVAPDASSQIVHRSSQPRPFHADISGALDLTSSPTACSGDLGLNLLDYNLSGTATHLGLMDTDLSILHHDDCDLSLATMLLTTGVSGQLAAANGDLVYYTGEDVINVFNLLTASGPNGPITGTWTINGGTGRFDGASGTVTINGLVDFATLSFNVDVDGTITY